jgi:hypothetical protein
MELENRKIREKKYPDICALEWVMEESSLKIKALSFFKKIIIFIKFKFAQK